MLTLYTCNTCQKSKQFTEEQLISLQPSRCTITDNCKGTMYLDHINSSSLINNSPYGSRKRFFEHTQTVGAYKWNIDHNLQSYPDVQVFRQVVINEKLDYLLMDPNDYVVTHAENKTTIEFAEKINGIAHLIAKASADHIINTTSTTVEYIQATANTILTIATPYKLVDDIQTTILISAINNTTGKETDIDMVLTAHKLNTNISLFDTPWKDSQVISINNKFYRVRSIRFANFCTNNHISDGSPIFFNNDSESLILLSSYPYLDSVDKSTLVIPISGLRDYSCKVSKNELTVDASASVQYSLKPIIVKTIQD